MPPLDLSSIDLSDLIIAVCRRVFFELDKEKDPVSWQMMQALVGARTTEQQREVLLALLDGC